MSLNFGGGQKKTNTTQTGTASGTMSSTTNPWATSVPYLEDFLSRLGGASSNLGNVTPGQAAAYGELRANADRAGQFTPDIEALTRDYFATTSTSPMATDAYRRLETQLGDYASGAGANPMDDPAFKTLIDTVSTDAMNRVNSMFAGAGRDLSPENSASAARAVTQAQAPILVNQYNTNIQRLIDAARDLYGAGQETARNVADLDAGALATRERGISTAMAAVESMNLPANIRLQIEQQLKTLPIEELGLVAQQLFAAAGLGSSTTSTQSQTQRVTGSQSSSGNQWGIGARI